MANGQNIQLPSESPDQTGPDFEALAEQWYAGAVKHGGLAAATATLLEPVLGLVAGVLAFLFSLLDPIGLALGKGILDAFNTASAGPLETVLSLAADEFTVALEGSSAGKFGGRSAAAAIATAFVDRINRSAPTADNYGLAPTLDPAKQFIATLTEVGLRGWAMDLLAQLDTAGHITAFEDLIGIISRSIGFGRLSRLALQPLIKAAIADPAQAYVFRQYRPTLLSSAEAAKATWSGILDPATFTEELARQGYGQGRIRAILENARAKLPVAVAYRLMLDGQWQQSEFSSLLGDHGFSAADQVDYQRALQLERQDAIARQEIAEYLTLLRSGEIGFDDFKSFIGNVQLGSDELAAYAELAQVVASHPRKHLSVAQLGELLTKNIVTLGEYRDYLTRLGYADDDATLLELLEQKALNDKADAARAKQLVTQQKQQAKDQAAAAKQAAAEQKAAAAAATKAQHAQYLAAKQQAADAAHLARVQQTEAAALAHQKLIDQAQATNQITAGQATTARAALATVQAQSKAQAAAHTATVKALDTEQLAVDAAAVQQKVLAEQVSAKTKAAKARAALDQQLLDARQAARVASYQAERASADAAYAAGELTAAAYARKLRAIDLQEQKDVASEQVTAVQLAQAQQIAQNQIDAGQVSIDALGEKTQALPEKARVTTDAIAANLADTLTTIATVDTTRQTQLAALTATRQAATDAAIAAREQLDQQLAAQKLELEQTIIKNRPAPPG